MSIKNSCRKSWRRVQLLKRDGRCCHWCGDRMAWPDFKEGESGADVMTIEHIMPKALGGGNRLENLALACFACNTERGAIYSFGPLRRWTCAPPSKGDHP